MTSDRVTSGTDEARGTGKPSLSADDLALVSDEGGAPEAEAEADAGDVGDEGGGDEADNAAAKSGQGEDGDEAGAADDALSAEPETGEARTDVDEPGAD